MNRHYEKYNKVDYTSILLKRSIKFELESIIQFQEKKMSYPQVIKMLIDYYNTNERDKNNIEKLFNDEGI